MSDTRFDPQALIDAGSHVVCGCGWLIAKRPGAACRHCQQVQTDPRPLATRVAVAARGGQPPVDSMGGLGALPGRAFRLVVHGTPRPQGSLRAVAAGVVKPSPLLNAWRDSVTQAALLAAGAAWAPVRCAVRVEACFTLAAPKGHQAWVEPAFHTRPPDEDKLLRAVQDALSPKVPKAHRDAGQAQSRRFRLLDDDSLVVETRVAKTYPAPWNSHAWALEKPGLVLQVTLIDGSTGRDPMPDSTLGDGRSAMPSWLAAAAAPAPSTGRLALA